MADTSTSSSGTVPRSNSISAMVFWIVAVVLAIGIGAVYFLLNKDLTAMREDVNAKMMEQMTAQDKKSEKALDDAKQLLNAEIAKLHQDTSKVEVAAKATATDLGELTKKYDAFAKTEVPQFVKISKHEEDIAKKADASALSKTNSDVNAVETRVKYLEDKVGAINGKLVTLDADISKLGSGSAELKAELMREQSALKEEVAKVTKKGGATEEELLRLENRTMKFEHRVMAEHARQAAVALRNNDHKRLLQLLDEKDDDVKNVPPHSKQ